MKLDFLDDLTDNGKYPHADPDKLLRLYKFNRDEATRLKNLIDTEIIHKEQELDLSKIDFVECLNCTLVFKLSFQDIGIGLPPDGKSFLCELTLEGYKKMCNIIEQFSRDQEVNGYNWLYDPNGGKVDLLFSQDGSW